MGSVVTTNETERKYETDRPISLPEQAGPAGLSAGSRPEEQRLVAVYFDTEDLRPPLDRGGLREPPAELVSLTRPQTRGAELAPVAEPNTERRRWVLAHLGGSEGGNGFTHGVMHGLETRRAERAERDLPAAWRKLDRPKRLKWLS